MLTFFRAYVYWLIVYYLYLFPSQLVCVCHTLSVSGWLAGFLSTYPPARVWAWACVHVIINIIRIPYEKPSNKLNIFSGVISTKGLPSLQNTHNSIPFFIPPGLTATQQSSPNYTRKLPRNDDRIEKRKKSKNYIPQANHSASQERLSSHSASPR